MRLPTGIWVWLALGTSPPAPAHSAPLGAEFTYQGRLDQNGTPMTGTATLRFSLWDAAGSGSPPSGGTQVGASQTLSNVPVDGGLFTVQLNGANQFGPTAFAGDARWLQVEVCSGPACATSTVLSPRQPVTATPYARYSAGPWAKSGVNISYTGGHVGIGTALPQGPLEVASGTGSFLRVDSTYGDLHFNGGVDGAFGLYNDSGSSGRTEVIGGGVVRMAILNSGNVGIGTNLPASRLDVRGDIRLGSSGQHFATGGEENLRVLRGIVDGDGTAPHGCCFGVQRRSSGVYDITFAVPFSNVPAVTVTPSQYISVVRIGQPTVGSVQVVLEGDIPFHFIAVGPR
jgi:hypothetical protein